MRSNNNDPLLQGSLLSDMWFVFRPRDFKDAIWIAVATGFNLAIVVSLIVIAFKLFHLFVR